MIRNPSTWLLWAVAFAALSVRSGSATAQQSPNGIAPQLEAPAQPSFSPLDSLRSLLGHSRSGSPNPEQAERPRPVPPASTRTGRTAISASPPVPAGRPAAGPAGGPLWPPFGATPAGQLGRPGRRPPVDSDDRVSLAVRDASIGSVLSLIGQQHGLNVVTGDQVGGTISVALEDVPLNEALDAILGGNGYTWTRKNNILFVSSVTSGSRLSPFAQGREVQVFSLNYVSALDVDLVVQGLLSPVGQSFLTQADPLDNRRTREQLIVEDLPEYLQRIAAYIAQIDQPPRQVLIEAHVLEVTLKDDTRHGVDLTHLARLADARITLDTAGIADAASSTAFFLGVDGADLDGLIEILKTTTDAKTLASPKVLALNGQEARIQIGSQLGFFVTTTTQTSTLQNVDFIDVGVVLRVTPVISDDGRVLMSVKPEVSGGRINPETGLPEEDTTEVETAVLLNSGQAMVVGGLIKEEDTDVQNKLPLLGDIWLVGRAFQRRSVVRERSEIIIALLPRILPLDACPGPREQVELERVQTPLLEGPLRPLDRRGWESQLPDAMENPRALDPRRVPHAIPNLHDPYPLPRTYYYPTPEEVANGVIPNYGY